MIPNFWSSLEVAAAELHLCFVIKSNVWWKRFRLQCCQVGFFGPNLSFLAFFQLLRLFFIFEKKPKKIWLFLAFFGQLDFLCRFGRFKDDFGRFLGTGRFLSTVSGHRMVNFYWKLCTRNHKFPFCCFVLLGLEFRVALQQNQKFWEVN